MPPHEPDSPADEVPTSDVEQIKAPGLAAMVRRNPQLKRHAALASIAAGAVLFVVASMTTQLAGAATDHGTPQAESAAPTTSAPIDLSVLVPLADGASGAQAAKKVLRTKPVRAAHKAPVDNAVISGLAANGIPTVALNAYRVAAARMNNNDPGCGIDWSLLAGIGREESDHGRFGGASLHADGVSTPRIVGPALDGKHWDLIPAPANGLALDGDAVYAHALGPMQFIPQTWAGYGADANGDGIADIFNINDAALGAARYLCAAGGNLRTHAGQVAAVLAYNHSDQYLAQVLALADAYHRGVPITGIPVGNITGKITPVKRTGYLPPANPGGPTATDRNARSKTATHKPAAKPTPSTSRTGSNPAAHSSSTPSKPTGGSASTSSSPTKSSGPSASPSKTPSPGPSSSPSPSATKSCDPLSALLHLC